MHKRRQLPRGGRGGRTRTPLGQARGRLPRGGRSAASLAAAARGRPRLSPPVPRGDPAASVSF